MESREPGQVRKEAALSGLLHVPRTSLTGVETRPTRLGARFDGRCTVHCFRLPSRAAAATRMDG